MTAEADAPRPRVLVLYSSFGTGHRTAAEAVVEALRSRAPAGDYRSVDSLEVCYGRTARHYSQLYEDAVSRTPGLWEGLCYGRGFMGILAALGRLVEGVVGRRLRGLLEESRPHVVVSTHFVPSSQLSVLKRRGVLGAPFVTVITDFWVHPFWVAHGTHAYIFGSPAMAEERPLREVPGEKLHPFGIPVRERFARACDPPALKKDIGLSPDRLVICTLGGGMGMGPYRPVLEAAGKLRSSVHVIFAAGRDRALAKRLEKETKSRGLSATVLPFVTDIERYMGASDVVVMKPGGLSVAETTAMGLPVILMNPMPGHEYGNAVFLSRRCGLDFARTDADLGRLLDSINRDPSVLTRMRKASREMGRPTSAAQTASLILGLCGATD